MSEWWKETDPDEPECPGWVAWSLITVFLFSFGFWLYYVVAH